MHLNRDAPPEYGAPTRPRAVGLPRSRLGWRCSRPLGGAVLTIAAGTALVLLPAGSYTLVLLPGLAGITGFLFGAGLWILGFFLLLQPRSHAFVGAVSMLVALASVATTNLGGFGIGVLLGIVGGALALAWTPESPTRLSGRGTPRPSDRHADPNPTEEPTQPLALGPRHAKTTG